eukprot:m.151401 g.151401  ORF g.151401 m.151401 type:complete len:934 (-) comp16199_c4_seq2:139-2940(-)
MFSWVKFKRASLPEIEIDDIGRIIEAVMDAVVKDNDAVMRELADRNLINDEFLIGRSKRNVLHIAASFGAVNCIKVLAKKGFNINARDIGQVTPLHLAARNGHKSCVKALVVDFGADTTLSDSSGFTVLHWLASNGRTHLLNYALLLGLNSDVVDCHGQTLLHVACHSGHAATVEQLIAHGVDVNAQDNNFMTALHSTCKFGQPVCAAVLLKYGALQLLDKDGKLPITHALENTQKECVLLLVEHVPELMTHVFKYAWSLTTDHDACLGILRHICTSRNSFAQIVIKDAVSHTLLCGQKLMCSSGESEQVMAEFRRFVSILAVLLVSVHTHSELKYDDMLVQLLHKEVEELQQLWDTLHGWMCLVSGDDAALGSSVANSVEPPTATQADSENDPDGSTGLQEVTANLCLDDEHGDQASSVAQKPAAESCESSEQHSSGPTQHHTSQTAPAQPTDSEQAHAENTRTEHRPAQSELTPRIMLAVRGMYHIQQAMFNATSSTLCSPVFLQFAQHHATAFQKLVCQKPSALLEDFDFVLSHAELMKVFRPAVLQQPFPLRRKWFMDRLATLHPELQANSSEHRVLVIDRHNLLQSSCERLQALNAQELQNSFAIEFRDEAGHGQGVKREWFTLLSKEIFNPDYALFELSPDEQSYLPNLNSSINPDHLAYFQFLGRILALASIHKQTLPVRLAAPVYKHLLGLPATIEDVALFDPPYAQSLRWILENPIAEADLDLTFSVEHDAFGDLLEEELIPNGRLVAVTEENKAAYVQMLCEWKLAKAMRTQLDAIALGFSEFISLILLQLFDENELNRIVSGESIIDVDDWRKHTELSGYEPEQAVVHWFWEYVAALSLEKRAMLLQFSTGSPTLPVGGFEHLPTSDGLAKFTLAKVDNSHDLPTASTCFNLLRMPEYPSKEALRKAFDAAITYATEGFAFA